MLQGTQKDLYLQIMCIIFKKHTCNSCYTGVSALPDRYAQHLKASVDISGNARVPALQLLLYVTLQIFLNFLVTTLPIYVAKDNHYDNGILILTFP